MSKRISWLVVAGLFGAVALTAQQPPPPDSLGPRPLRQRVRAPDGGFMAGAGMYAPARLVNRREVLKLTPDQVSRLEGLAQEARQARGRADSAARTHAEALRTLWDAPQPDVRAIEQHHQALATARQAAALAEIRAAAQAKGLLTDEQRGHVAGWRDGARMMLRRDARPGPGRRPQIQRMRPQRRMRPI